MPDVLDRGPLRILAAEDVAVNRELIRLFLEPRGFVVDTVCDGFEAIEAVMTSDYDLIIMDMQMPGMDGLEATRAIRKLGGDKAALPIVALSANIIPDQVRMCLEAGMTAHLSKPFTSEDLCDAVKRWTRHPSPSSNLVLKSFVEQAGWDSVRGLLDMLRVQIDMLEGCSTNDRKQLGGHAHALRGAAAVLGYAPLAAACGALEDACNALEPTDRPMLLVQDAVKAAKAEIALELQNAA